MMNMLLAKRQTLTPIKSLLETGTNYLSLTGFQPIGLNTAIIGITFGNITAGTIEIEVSLNGTVSIIKNFQAVPMLPDSQFSRFPKFAVHPNTGNSVRVWQEKLASGLLVIRAQTFDKNGLQLGLCTLTNGIQNQIGHTVAISENVFAICAVEGNNHHIVHLFNLDCTRLSSPVNPVTFTYKLTLIGNDLETGGFYNTLTLSDNGALTVLTKYLQSNGHRIYIEGRNISNWDPPLIPPQKIVDNNGGRVAPSCALSLNDGVTCANKFDKPKNQNDNIEIHTIGNDNIIKHPGNANGAIKLGRFPPTTVYSCLSENCSLVFFINKNNGNAYVTKVMLDESGHATTIDPAVSFQTSSDVTKLYAVGEFPNGHVININIKSGNLQAIVYPYFTKSTPRWPLDLNVRSITQITAPSEKSATTFPTANSNLVALTQPTSDSPISLPTNTQQFTTQTILSMLGSPAIQSTFDIMQTTRETLPMLGTSASAGISTGVIAGAIAAFFGLLYCVAILIGVFYKLRAEKKDGTQMNTLDYALDGARSSAENSNPATNPCTRISVYQNSAPTNTHNNSDKQAQQTSEEGYDKFPTAPVIQYDQDEFASARNSAGPAQYQPMTNTVFNQQYDSTSDPLHTGKTITSK